MSKVFILHRGIATRALTQRDAAIHARIHSRPTNHSRRTQAFYVRVIKHFACEGIIVGVGPVRAVYTVLAWRGTVRDGEGYVV